MTGKTRMCLLIPKSITDGRRSKVLLLLPRLRARRHGVRNLHTNILCPLHQNQPHASSLPEPTAVFVRVHPVSFVILGAHMVEIKSYLNSSYFKPNSNLLF